MNPRRGVFITGTDTGVGKTHVAALLSAALRTQGVRVKPKKPVESACIRGPHGLVAADAIVLWRAAGRPGVIDEICRYRFAQVASPERAARLSRVKTSLAEFAKFCLQDVDEDDFLLVEGAGGFYSPLAEDGLNADLAQALNLPLLIVAPDRLGVIGQVLLIVEAAKRRDLLIAGVVLNAWPAAADIDVGNSEELRRHIEQAVVGTEDLGSIAGQL